MAAALFSDGPTYRSQAAVYIRIEPSTGTPTGSATWSSGHGWGGTATVAATSVTIEVPIDPLALALHKAIARHPRSRGGRLCSVAREGRIGYAPCWNRQESTPPARTFQAEATYKARVVAELQRVRAKRG